MLESPEGGLLGVAGTVWAGRRGGNRGGVRYELGRDRSEGNTPVDKEVKTDFNLALKSGRYEQDFDNYS